MSRLFKKTNLIRSWAVLLHASQHTFRELWYWGQHTDTIINTHTHMNANPLRLSFYQIVLTFKFTSSSLSRNRLTALILAFQSPNMCSWMFPFIVLFDSRINTAHLNRFFSMNLTKWFSKWIAESTTKHPQHGIWGNLTGRRLST